MSVHCSRTEETYHMIRKEKLRIMKSVAILVNSARGGTVDETALLNALREEE